MLTQPDARLCPLNSKHTRQAGRKRPYEHEYAHAPPAHLTGAASAASAAAAAAAAGAVVPHIDLAAAVMPGLCRALAAAPLAARVSRGGNGGGGTAAADDGDGASWTWGPSVAAVGSAAAPPGRRLVWKLLLLSGALEPAARCISSLQLEAAAWLRARLSCGRSAGPRPQRRQLPGGLGEVLTLAPVAAALAPADNGRGGRAEAWDFTLCVEDVSALGLGAAAAAATAGPSTPGSGRRGGAGAAAASANTNAAAAAAAAAASVAAAVGGVLMLVDGRPFEEALAAGASHEEAAAEAAQDLAERSVRACVCRGRLVVRGLCAVLWAGQGRAGYRWCLCGWGAAGGGCVPSFRLRKPHVADCSLSPSSLPLPCHAVSCQRCSWQRLRAVLACLPPATAAHQADPAQQPPQVPVIVLTLASSDAADAIGAHLAATAAAAWPPPLAARVLSVADGGGATGGGGVRVASLAEAPDEVLRRALAALAEAAPVLEPVVPVDLEGLARGAVAEVVAEMDARAAEQRALRLNGGGGSSSGAGGSCSAADTVAAFNELLSAYEAAAAATAASPSARWGLPTPEVSGYGHGFELG